MATVSREQHMADSCSNAVHVQGLAPVPQTAGCFPSLSSLQTFAHVAFSHMFVLGNARLSLFWRMGWGGVGWDDTVRCLCAHGRCYATLCCWLHPQPMGWMVNAIKNVLNRLIQFRRNPLSRFLHHTVWWFLYVFVASGRGGCGGVGGACDFLFFHTETTVPALVVWALGLRRQRGATKGKGLVCNFDSLILVCLKGRVGPGFDQMFDWLEHLTGGEQLTGVPKVASRKHVLPLIASS